MIICFYSFVFLTIFRLTSSDLIDEEYHGNHKNIFLDPVKPQLEHCHTSLGEHGRCMPLNDCPPLRDFAEGKGKSAVVSVVQDFGCEFRKVLFVCCTDPSRLKPIEGPAISYPLEHPHVHHQGERHHDHPHHPPDFFQPDKLNGNRRPGLESVEFSGFGEKKRPEKKGSHGYNSESPDEVNEKPVYEEVEEGDNTKGKNHPKEKEESKKDQSTTPLYDSSDFVVPQEDSWVWPSGRKNSEKYPGTKSTPDWVGVQQTSSSLGGFGSVGQGNYQYNVKPSQFGSAGLTENSGFGVGMPISGTGTFSNGGLSGIQSSGTFSNSNQGFGIGSSNTHGTYDAQGFGSSSSLGNQGFGSSRPGSTFSTSEDLINGRPSHSGLNSQNPQTFGSYDNQGLGSIDKPVSQGFGNERPSGSGFSNERPSIGLNRPNNYNVENNRPSGGLNRPNNYEGENRRPGSGRPGSVSNQRPTNYQEGSFGLGNFLGGGSNNQRPINEGSSKKPNRGRPNKRRLLPDGKCGTEISDKIIGGENTQLDEFPWMTLLHFTNRNGQNLGYGCGGSLINERYVLTAAHCIKGPSLPENVVVKDVRLGEYDLTKDRDCVNEVCSPSPLDVAVEEIIAHPDYKPNDKAQHHDIALIRLRQKVPFTTYVSPICLPGDELKSKDYTGKQMTVAGWGKIANGADAKSSAIKQKVTIPFVPLSECKPFYEGINIHLRNTQLCAGGERAKDSCQGDSGGPLMTNEVINGQSSWFATGIVSFGPENCGIQNIAGVYTRVSEYVDWILDNMRE